MPDWTRSMQQTYEYYEVNPDTWKDNRKIDTIEKCTITRDADDETKGSASISCLEDMTDHYIRTYLVTTQDGVTERHTLGTHLYQTPSIRFDGKYTSIDQDGYTPLTELKERPPSLGFSLRKGANILEMATTLITDQVRAPVVPGESDKKLIDSFVSEVEDTWLYFITDLIANAGYFLGVDEEGRILFETDEPVTKLQPVWEFNDDNSSILLPEVEIERDLYGIPNVVEVVYSPSNGTPMYSRVTNTDENSIVSIPSRGREIVYRDTNPNVVSGLTQEQLDEYATNLLQELSSLEYTVTFSHGYCPVRLGDCVLLNYKSADLVNTKAKITRQTINCESGCTIEETAVFTKELWEG